MFGSKDGEIRKLLDDAIDNLELVMPDLKAHPEKTKEALAIAQAISDIKKVREIDEKIKKILQKELGN